MAVPQAGSFWKLTDKRVPGAAIVDFMAVGSLLETSLDSSPSPFLTSKSVDYKAMGGEVLAPLALQTVVFYLKDRRRMRER